MHVLFEYFDPMNPELPAVPFFEVHSIASRARALISERTKNELIEILQIIECEVEEFFHAERQRAMEELQTALLMRVEEGEYIEPYEVTEIELLEQTSLRDRDNTTDLEALREVVRYNGGPLDLAPPNYVIFAVLALVKVDEYVRVHSTVFDPDTMSLVPRKIKRFERIDMGEMGKLLLEATDAVGYAEQLRIIDKIANWRKNQADDLQPELSELTSEAVVQLQAGIRTELAEEAAKADSEAARKRNDIRHERNRKYKALVQDAFEENSKNFSSAEDAADHFREVLRSKGANFRHRTVAEWIRERARARGMRLQP